MTPDQIWQAIDTQRAALCDLLDDFDDDQWRQPSLCPGCTVRDVAAHLTLQQLSPSEVLGQMLHWRGGIDRTTAHAARRRAAAWTTDRLTAEIRATIGSRRHPGRRRLPVGGGVDAGEIVLAGLPHSRAYGAGAAQEGLTPMIRVCRQAA